MTTSTPGTCQSGHAVLPGEQYCPTCGEYLRVDDRQEQDPAVTWGADRGPTFAPSYDPSVYAPTYPAPAPAFPADPYNYPGPYGFAPTGAYGHPVAPYGYPYSAHPYAQAAPYGYPAATYGYFGYAPRPAYPPPGGYLDPRHQAQPWHSPRYSGYPGAYAPYGGPYYYRTPTTVTNPMAIASLILGLIWFWGVGSIAAVLMGHAALNQIKRSGEQGRTPAILGIIFGWIGIVALVITIAVAASNS